ncbi:unnamed protein product, partial [Symbiodinium sp. KB8]
RKAAEELRQVGPLTNKQVEVALVAEAFRTWEATGVMPETATMYPLHEEWARQYQLSSPWDGDPTIRDIHRDLGVDSGARKKRLDILAPDRGPNIRAFKQGVLSVALYGHVALGLAPKRLKWIRHQQAQVLGRMSLGSTEHVLELANSKHEDPAFIIINQHSRFFHQLLVKWNQGQLEEIDVSWRFWYKRIMSHKEPWRIVVGPIGAAICYLKALGWAAPSLTVWRACNKWRWKALSQSEAGSSLAAGVQWQDSRFQVLTWGVIAFKILGSEIQVVGSASGPVACEQTVFRAEAQALVYLVGKVQGHLEVTTDAKSVTKAVQRRPGWKSEDLLQPLREAKERLHLTWVNSHLTQQEFACKFGEASLWRWRSNQLVDKLVQTQANGCRDMEWEQKVLIRDEEDTEPLQKKTKGSWITQNCEWWKGLALHEMYQGKDPWVKGIIQQAVAPAQPRLELFLLVVLWGPAKVPVAKLRQEAPLVAEPCLESVPKAKPKPKDRRPGDDQEDGPVKNQPRPQAPGNGLQASQNPADEQEYSYYSTEEEGPAGEPSSDSSTSDAEDDMPGTSAPNPGEDQDMEASKNKEEATTPPKPNPSEVTLPPEAQQPKPKEEDNQSAGAREATGPKEK